MSDKFLFDISLSDIDVDGDRATSIAFSGWLVCDFFMIETIELWRDGLLVSYGPLTVERPDVVASLHPRAVRAECGFTMRFSKLLLGKGARLEVRAVERNPDGLLCRHVLGDITNLPPLRINWNIAPQITPILVVGMGRSGTSALMEALSQHPEVIVPGNFPYELRQFSYLCQSAYMLTGPSDYSRSTKPDEFEFDAKIGFNPFLNRDWEKAHDLTGLAKWQDQEFPEEIINFIIQQVDKMSIASQTPPKPCARFIAEKFNVSPLRWVVENLYPKRREIFLVRDFRDVYISARKMNARRGTKGFGQSEFDSDLNWLHGLGWSARQFRLAYISTEPTPLLIRYEDLVTSPGQCIKNIIAHIGLREDQDFIEELISGWSREIKNTEHMTSKSSSESVGRWKFEMTDEEKKIAQDAFGEELAYFGY